MNIKNEDTGILKTKQTKSKIKLMTASFFTSLLLVGSILVPSTDALASQANAKTTDVQNGEYLSHLVKHKKYKKKHHKKKHHKKRHKHVSDDNDTSDSSNNSNSEDMSLFRQHCPGPDIKIFVKNGATNGNGTRKSPYGSLANAQADTSGWTLLVVIPTHNPLVGSIHLEECQSIKGQGPNPVKAGPYSKIATIQGTPGTLDAITLSGNHRISNLKILDSDRAAIDLTYMENLFVKDVLIRNANVGDYQEILKGIFPVGFESSAMAPQSLFDQFGPIPTKNGKLVVKNSRIDGVIGSGIFEVNGFSDAVRTTVVKNTTIQNLIGTSKQNSFGFSLADGINSIITGSTQYHLEADNLLIENIFADSPTGIGIEEILDFGTPAMSSSANIRNSTIRNINTSAFGGAFLQFQIQSLTEHRFVVNNNIFDNGAEGTNFTSYFGGNLDLIFTNNKISNVTQNMAMMIRGSEGGLIDADITGNTYENLNVDVITLLGDYTQNGLFKNVKANISSNKFTNYGLSSRPSAGIISVTIPGFDATVFGGPVLFGGWDESEVKLEDNCFKNGPIGILDYYGQYGEGFQNIPYPGLVGSIDIMDAGGGPLGSQGNNSFVNMTLVDIAQTSESDPVPAQATIYIQDNYWGGGPAGVAGNADVRGVNDFLNSDPCDEDSDSSDSSDSSS